MAMTARLAALWILLLLGPGARIWAASTQRTGAPVPVSKPWAVVLKKFARSQASKTYYNGTDIAALARIDVGDPRERLLFSPWVRSLREMRLTPKKLAAMDPRERERFMSVHVENAAVNGVIAEVHRLRDQAEDGRTRLSDLSQTAQAIERLRRVVEIHAPFKAGILADAYDKTQQRPQARP